MKFFLFIILKNACKVAFMNEEQFWQNIKVGVEKLGIPLSTYRVWKFRGRVSRDAAIPLYQSLLGTENEISLDLVYNSFK